MMSKYFIVLMMFMAIGLEAKSTTIASFWVKKLQFQSLRKRFYNQTGQTIELTWSFIDKKSGAFYKQGPIIKPNNFVDIALSDVKHYFAKRSGKQGYEVTIQVARVLKYPQQKGDEIITIEFRNGQEDLVLSSKTFTENAEFELVKDSAGNIDCKPKTQKS